MREWGEGGSEVSERVEFGRWGSRVKEGME